MKVDTLSQEMRTSWLVQRLNKPVQNSILSANVFSFGGGLKNGGLSDEAMNLIKDIWSFDYMGSAEFEFGAVPEALRNIASNKNLTAWSFVFDKSKMKWESWDARGGLEKPTGEVEIYVLSSPEHKTEIKRRIKAWATSPYSKNYSTKESVGLHSALSGRQDTWAGRVAGWLELNNGFMFFTDKEMFDKTCTLFGVKQ